LSPRTARNFAIANLTRFSQGVDKLKLPSSFNRLHPEETARNNSQKHRQWTKVSRDSEDAYLQYRLTKTPTNALKHQSQRQKHPTFSHRKHQDVISQSSFDNSIDAIFKTVVFHRIDHSRRTQRPGFDYSSKMED